MAALRNGWFIALVLIVAAALRFHGLELRSMHSDEANQAVKLGHLLEGTGYRFDPNDHHGPTLYYFGALGAILRGETSLPALTEAGVRATPAAFGVLGVALLWILARPLGAWSANVAALLYAVAPAAVYYSRYFIQETLLATFTLAAFACGYRWWHTRTARWALAAGVAIGLMLATKASALIYLAAGLMAVPTSGLGRDGAGQREGMLAGAGWAAAGALAVAMVFYSSFFQHFSGVIDAIRSVGAMFTRGTAGATGHEKPFWYYAGLFVFQRSGGYFWDQTLFIVMAAAGGVMAFRGSRLIRFIALFVVLAGVVLCAAPYKTPWQIVNLLPGLCLLAAWAITRVRAAAAIPLALAVTMLLGWQTWQAAFSRPADARNPYAYAHSSPDVRRAESLARAAPGGPVKVIAEEYWPLPWYLRHRPEVGYWTTPPGDCDAALIFVDAANADAVRARLVGSYHAGFIGLRPGVVLEVLVREER